MHSWVWILLIVVVTVVVIASIVSAVRGVDMDLSGAGADIVDAAVSIDLATDN